MTDPKIQRAANKVAEDLKDQGGRRVKKTVSMSLDAENYDKLLKRLDRGAMSATIDALIAALLEELDR